MEYVKDTRSLMGSSLEVVRKTQGLCIEVVR